MGPIMVVLILKGNLKIEIDFFSLMVIKLDCGGLLGNSFLSELLSGGLYCWKRRCCAGLWRVVRGWSYQWASGSGLPGLPSASLGEAESERKEEGG